MYTGDRYVQNELHLVGDMLSDSLFSIWNGMMCFFCRGFGDLHCTDTIIASGFHIFYFKLRE